MTISNNTTNASHIGRSASGIGKINIIVMKTIGAALVTALAMRRPAVASDHELTNDAAVQAVAGACLQLQRLDLSGCRSITAAGVQAVYRGCPKLRRAVRR